MSVPWVDDFPTGWQYSGNSGASWSPAASSYGQVVGPTGTQRFRAQFTIPAGAPANWAVTVSGDIHSNLGPAHLYYDGVDQGAVNTPSLYGPQTFVLPAVPGPHTVELWIGNSSSSAGLTVPTVTFSSAVDCDCCPLGGCFTIEGNASQPAFGFRCNGETRWYDADGVPVAASDVQPCPAATGSAPVPFTVADLRMVGGAFGDDPSGTAENLCNVVPAPSATTGWAAPSGGCYDPVTGAPTMNWGPLQTVEMTYDDNGNGAASGGVLLTFSVPSLGVTITWPTNLTTMTVGEQRWSNLFGGGRAARLTYVSGPATDSIRMEGGGTIGVHRAAVANYAGIRFRLEFFTP